MSTHQRLAPSRRNVLRTAAWTVPAVSVVVATPNIAAASPGATVPSVIVGSNEPIKFSRSNDKFVAWDLNVRSTNMDLTGLVLQLTFNQVGGGGSAELTSVAVRNFPVAASWAASVTKASMPANATATYGGTIPVNTTANIHVEFHGTDNSTGTVAVNLMAQDSAGNLVSIGSVAATSWGSGKEHSH